MATRHLFAFGLSMSLLLVLPACSGDGDTAAPNDAMTDETSSSKSATKPVGVDTVRGSQGYRDQFTVDRKTLAHTGTGKYWSLQAGHRMVYRTKDGDRLTITVLRRTIEIDGVTCRVVEEREDVNGQIQEISLNYFAADPKTGDLYYFGEDVDVYKGGSVVAHPGSWRSGVNGARFGLAVPGAPKVGMKYFQEIAPKVAMDRGEVVSISGRQTAKYAIAGISDDPNTPPSPTAKTARWDNCMLVRESTPLEQGTEEKWYAPGVGLIRDGEFELAGVFDE